LEVFRGAGGLSGAVLEIGGENVNVLAANGREFESVDVADDNDFEKLLQADVQWLHGAPPCKTFLRGTKLVAAKEVREKENAAAIGGLRNPNKAVAKSKDLQEVGRRARAVFEKLGEEAGYRAEVVATVNTLGDKNAEGFSKDIVEKLRTALRKEFNAKESTKSTVFDYELWRTLLQAAGDVEVDVPDWLENGCPTGIGKSIIHDRGVFPKVDAASASVLSSKEYAKQQALFEWRMDRHRNYKSFYLEEGKFAKEEINRIKDRGFVDTFKDWSEVVARWPDAKASKVSGDSVSAPTQLTPLP
jgi:hypothetical protein